MSGLHRRGDKIALQSASADARLQLVFEDDGSTGYLYVLDHTDGSAQPIKDAVQLYNVDASASLEQDIAFRWSDDGTRCILSLSGVAVAFVDFERQEALARSNFPPMSMWSRRRRAQWSDTVVSSLNQTKS